MKLFITLLLLSSMSSVLAHPEIELHTHDGASEQDAAVTSDKSKIEAL